VRISNSNQTYVFISGTWHKELINCPKLNYMLSRPADTFIYFCGSTVIIRTRASSHMRFLELFKHTVGLLGRVISPSQGLYLHRTTQHRNTRTNIHALSGIRTHDPSNQPAKTHASDRTATVTDLQIHCFHKYHTHSSASLLNFASNIEAFLSH
jgi:hypothetical protein